MQIRLGRASSSVVRNLDFTKQAGGSLEGPGAQWDDEGFIKSTHSPQERVACTGEGIKATDFILSLRRITLDEEKWNTAGKISRKREKMPTLKDST